MRSMCLRRDPEENSQAAVFVNVGEGGVGYTVSCQSDGQRLSVWALLECGGCGEESHSGWSLSQHDRGIPGRQAGEQDTDMVERKCQMDVLNQSFESTHVARQIEINFYKDILCERVLRIGNGVDEDVRLKLGGSR